MKDAPRILYSSQKQLPREMESHLVIIVGAGYIFWQLFLRRLSIVWYLTHIPQFIGYDFR